MELSTWIKLARTKQGWTQDQLATALDVTKGNVSAWENGRHEPSWDRILKIGRLTGEPLPIPLELLAPLIKHLSDLTSEKVNEAAAEKDGKIISRPSQGHERQQSAQEQGVEAPGSEPFGDGKTSLEEAAGYAQRRLKDAAATTKGKKARQGD